ncbi:MAG: hypothetical protein JNJ83_20095 [Verrucomicrobiaceae bacterium]|nr:hypothetical protein [Verrucomicrobiaceae bacterium]
MPPFSPLAFAALTLELSVASMSAQDLLVRHELSVDGVKREALVYTPASATARPAPLVFGWHGHGGTMRNAARSFRIHEIWPEAIVVYPQGLNTPGRLTDPEGKKAGWQGRLGDQGDRDLKFFDAIWQKLHAGFKVDDNRVYSTGHSNGGGFTYLLWAARGDKLTAIAPSASAGRNKGESNPLPVLHLAGRNDPLVKFAWQEAMIRTLRELNKTSEGKAWDLDERCTIYPSAIGAPLVTAIHDGGHEYPKGAPELIVKFFKAHSKAKG